MNKTVERKSYSIGQVKGKLAGEVKRSADYADYAETEKQ